MALVVMSAFRVAITLLHLHKAKEEFGSEKTRLRVDWKNRKGAF